MFSLYCLTERFYKMTIYLCNLCLKHKESDLVFSLLVTCYGKTPWNQNGRIKSEVHFAAWYCCKVCYLPMWLYLLSHLYFLLVMGPVLFCITAPLQSQFWGKDLSSSSLNSNIRNYHERVEEWEREEREERNPAGDVLIFKLTLWATGAQSHWVPSVWLYKTYLRTLLLKGEETRVFVHPLLIKICC